MEDLGLDASFWRGRSVFLTGVTGFKGGWLALWLQNLGARVTGYSLAPPTEPSLFVEARVGDGLQWHEGDIRDAARLREAVIASKPEIVFHLAAQPLVRASYDIPVETYETNVMGTVHVLEGVRAAPSVRSVVVVTSDKCYENREVHWPYRETDPLGGHDPYSSSKACTEIVASSYWRSFLQSRGIGLATVRAGNVIGGGDWAKDRLVPDAMRALAAGESVLVRNPASVRPWQHVLEPLAGYLRVAERLTADGERFSEGWNFGPGPDAACPVSELMTEICALWGAGARFHSESRVAPHEAKLLSLDASKARARLGWRPRLSLRQALSLSVDWYRAHGESGSDMQAFTLRQIRRYEEPSP